MDRREEIAGMFRELAELTEIDEESPAAFRVRAYENAVQAVRSLPSGWEEMSVVELAKRRGIGKSVAQKIRELLDNGKMEKLEALRAKHPKSVVELSRVPGIGPKTVAKLRKELGVASIGDLRRALADNRLREIGGFGQKSEEKILAALDRVAKSEASGRSPIAKAMPVAERIVAALMELDIVKSAHACGSLRRLSETIGDVDVLVESDRAADVMSAFVELPFVEDVIGHGDKKTSVRTREGLQVDVRVVRTDELGAALLYFTGSKAHNIELRQRAIERGWTLNEYALSIEATGDVVASRTEEEIYDALGLEWIPPPMREGAGEVDAAAAHALPERVEVEHMKGDLHVHTDRSGDAHTPIDEIVAAAVARGYAYLALTDHAEGLPMNGVSREALLEQREEIERLRDEHPGFSILQGVELNIGPTGELDYDQDFRMGLDFCVAAVHSHFDLDQASQTKRIIHAMENPAVSVIGHLSGRMIGKRPGIDLDIDAVLDAAVETHTAIEINASLPRLDAAADVLKRARERDVVLVISSDTHHVRELDRMRWGAKQAQRGWVDRSRVANTWERARFLAWVKEKREKVAAS